MTITQTVTRLLDEARAGSAAARDELIVYAWNRLQRLARLQFRRFPRLRHFMDAEDVRSAAIVRLTKTLEALVPQRTLDFLCLLARDLRRTLIDLARKFGRIPPPPGDRSSAAFPTPAADDGDPQEIAALREFDEYVAGLPDETRALWELLYYQGLTQQEAADLMGFSVRTLKRRWQDAREAATLRFGLEARDS